jgi:hypothetical protein
VATLISHMSFTVIQQLHHVIHTAGACVSCADLVCYSFSVPTGKIVQHATSHGNDPEFLQGLSGFKGSVATTITQPNLSSFVFVGLP